MPGTYAIVEAGVVVGFVQRSQGIQSQFVDVVGDAGLGWTYDPVTNTFTQPWTSNAALAELKRVREEAIQADLNGFSMRNPQDIVNIQQTIDGLEAIPAAKAAGQLPAEYLEAVSFRKADNSFQLMDLDAMKGLYLQYLLRKQQAWAAFEAAVTDLAVQ